MQITMDCCKQRSASEERKQERLRQKRMEWLVQQELERKYEERKLKMIEEYERKRAEAIAKQNGKSKSLQSSSLQRRETSSPNNKGNSEEQKASVIVNGREGIDEKELKKIKIKICKESSLSEDQNVSHKIDRDIINKDDIILPRRQNEGAYPIFQRNKIKTEEIRIITYSENEQVSEKQLSTSRKNVYIHGRSNDDIIQRHCDSSLYESTTHRDDRTNDDDKYRDRRSSSMRNSKEKDRSRSEGRDRTDRSSLRYSSRNIPLTRNYSRPRYSPRPMLMPRIPPVFMPVFPGSHLVPFPINIHRWQLPPNMVSRQKIWNPR